MRRKGKFIDYMSTLREMSVRQRSHMCVGTGPRANKQSTEQTYTHTHTHLEGNKVHPVERLRGVVELRVPEGDEEAVSAEADVLAHVLAVHTDQLDRECLGHEITLFIHGKDK